MIYNCIFRWSDGHTSFANFHKCLTEVKEWLTNNFLQLNEDKSEFIMFGNKMPGNDLIESYGLLSNNSYVKNLGVFFDSEIRFDRQVNSVVKTSLFLLRKLSKLKSILSYKDLEIVQYEVLMFVYKALHNQAPEYIKDMLIPYQSQRHLRSSQNILLTVPRSRLRRSGDRAFSVAAPALWNVLPLSIKLSSSMDIFKKDLKTYLFYQAFGV